jgi:DNA repair protein RecO (recombination protein O)
MASKTLLQPAYVIHSRPYRNTSLIVEMFTQNEGRQTVVARSARGLKSRYQGQLQSFVPLLISYSGQSELKNLANVELSACPLNLEGAAMMCGFYLNELLLRLLQKGDEHEKLFLQYENTLRQLEAQHHVQLNLRLFEKSLLTELGYALNLVETADTKLLISADKWYRFVPDRGLFEVLSDDSDGGVFQGDSLLALDHGALLTKKHLNDAKRLLRQALGVYLGSKPLMSRECL